MKLVQYGSVIYLLRFVNTLVPKEADIRRQTRLPLVAPFTNMV